MRMKLFLQQFFADIIDCPMTHDVSLSQKLQIITQWTRKRLLRIVETEAMFAFMLFDEFPEISGKLTRGGWKFPVPGNRKY